MTTRRVPGIDARGAGPVPALAKARATPNALSAARILATALTLAGALALPASAQPSDAPNTPSPEVIAPIPALDIPGYMGTWYQVAWFPNRFQRQCASDTTATYRALPEGRVEVLNRCRLADGRLDEARGLARPKDAAVLGNSLQPARLEVSFLPAALRWLPIWGSYWVLHRPEDGRYAVIGEPSRQYLWVLSRTPQLSADDETAIRSRLARQGYDLSRWQAHAHPGAAVNAGPAPAAAR